ncbi:hypothetical protein PSSHI_22220 [Photobacterium sp. R1]
MLILGGLIQAVAVYIAFFSQFSGHLYIATILMVVALSSLMAIRSLIAPVCLLAGVIVGLALSHNQTDIKLLNQVGSVLKSAAEPDWNVIQNGTVTSEAMTSETFTSEGSPK